MKRTSGKGFVSNNYFYGDINGRLFMSPFGPCSMKTEIRRVVLTKADSCKWPKRAHDHCPEDLCYQRADAMGPTAWQCCSWINQLIPISIKARNLNGDWFPPDPQHMSFRKGCWWGLFSDLIKCRYNFFHLIFTISANFVNSLSLKLNVMPFSSLV